MAGGRGAAPHPPEQSQPPACCLSASGLLTLTLTPRLTPCEWGGGCLLWGGEGRKEEGVPRSRSSTSGVGLTHREMEGARAAGRGGEGRGVQARH